MEAATQTKPSIRRLKSPFEIDLLRPLKDVVLLESGLLVAALYGGKNEAGEMVFTARDGIYRTANLISSIAASRAHISLDNGGLKFAAPVKMNYFPNMPKYQEKDKMLQGVRL